MPRFHPDRHALAIGARVQLSWVKHAPYTQRADLAVPDRLGLVTAREQDTWIVVDEVGDSHRIDDAALEVAAPDATAGRWRIDGAIPAYHLGERLRLHWRHRSTAIVPDPPRDDCHATVIAEDPSVVTARLDDGREIVLSRSGAQWDEPDRKAARWFVVGRA